jgi:peroxiredoxin
MTRPDDHTADERAVTAEEPGLRPDPPLIDEESGIEERPQNRREWAGPLRSLVLPLLIVATLVGGLWYWQQRDTGGASNTADGLGIVDLPEAKNATGRSPSTDVGRAAPDFILETPDGTRLRLSDLQGKPVLVNFWASWCAPCRQEMPEIVRAYNAQQPPGARWQVVAVDLQENAGAVRAFADEFGMRFPVVIDRTGGVADAWRIGGPVEGIPSSYFLDAQGIVRARAFGPMSSDTLAANLRTVGAEMR